MKQTLLLIFAAALISLTSEAQAQTGGNVSGMPSDVYYLMPEFSDGISYSLDKVKDYPYNVKDVLLLYKGDEVYVFNKRNLRKLLPEKKAGLDDYFKSGGTIPNTLPEALEFLERWK